MALGDDRRALGKANEAARRAIGTRNEAARRAIGTRNEAARRGDQVVEDINRLRNPEPRRAQPLRTIAPVGPIPAATGRGVYKPPPAATAGGGIASPLTETLNSAGQPNRSYWPAQTLTTTDGLLVFQIRALRTLRMTDADGMPVVFEYAQFADDPEDDE